MFQYADAGKRPAAPVVVPVSLVLPLQSPSATACQRHAAAGTGADGALVFKHTDLQLRTHMSRVNKHSLKASHIGRGYLGFGCSCSCGNNAF